MIMKWLPIICIFFVFGGCKDKKMTWENDVPVYKFKMSQDDPVSLREICDSIEIVSLPSFRGWADMVKSYKDRYYVQNSQEVFIFDRAGVFVNKISSGEKGEGQYDKVADVVIDPFNETLLLLSQWRGVLEYTLDGKYLGTYRPEGSIYRIFPMNKDVFACLRMAPEKKIHYFSRKKEAYVASAFSLPDAFGMAFDLYGYMKDGVNYGAFHFLNTYYRIEADKIIPAYHFTTGRSPYRLSQVKSPPFKKPTGKGKNNRDLMEEYRQKRADWLNATFPVIIGEARAWGNWILADFKDGREGFLPQKFFYVLCNTKDGSCRKFEFFTEDVEFPLRTYFNGNEIVYLCGGEYIEDFVPYEMLDEREKKKIDGLKLFNPLCIVRLKLKVSGND